MSVIKSDVDKSALVSVIVPIYKVEAYLDECIESIVNQTYKNIEIILVDDGSPDACPAKCEYWKEKDSRIKVIHQENRGISAARNTGIKNSSGEWLVFVDSDDIVPDVLIDTMIRASEGSQRLVCSRCLRFVDEIPIYNKKDEMKSIGKDLVSERGGMYVCGILYSKNIVKKINLMFDSSLENIEDVVWNGIYLRYINEIICVDVPYYYRITPNSVTSKCSDSKWQILSWIAARKSLMTWFEDRELSKVQMNEVKKLYRLCQNNIYAECLMGNIKYIDLKNMEQKDGLKYCLKFISCSEKMLLNYMPRLYYQLYRLILKIKFGYKNKRQ